MSEPDAMLQEAITAIEEGRLGEGREILQGLLRVEPNNAEYWTWMSAAVTTLKERRYCLQKALAADPDYEPARRGLILLGDVPAEDVSPVRIPQPYAWETRFKSTVEAASSRPALPRHVVLGVAVLFLFGILTWGGWAAWQHLRPVHVATPQLLINTTRTPTPPPTGTPTPVNPLTLGKPTPLALLLPATYTPTPLIVSTPHRGEAYRLALRAMGEGRWEDALRYFRQASQAEGDSQPDLFFYLGEVYRRLNRLNDAAQAYRQALKIAPHFAPAEVGLAQVLLSQGKDKEAARYLAQALEDDPTYGPAYLVQAAYDLAHHQPEQALADLEEAERYLPDSPRIPLYRAQAYLALGEPQKAFENAKEAHDRDITLLPAYKLLGESALALHKADDAVLYLRTYLTYAPDDIEGYRLLADAYIQAGNYDGALAAAKKIAESHPYDADTLRMLGHIYLQLGQSSQAVDTLKTAVRIHPYDFDLHMALVEALLADGHPGDAFKELHESESLLKKKEQWFTFYYWRAKVLTALDVTDAALEDWQRVLTAPEDMVPDAWREEAQKAIAALRTPTPTGTAASPTPTP